MAAFCTKSSTLASVGSRATNSSRPLVEPISQSHVITFDGHGAVFAVSLSAEALRPHVSTRCVREKWCTSARPMPDPPPVTMIQHEGDGNPDAICRRSALVSWFLYCTSYGYRYSTVCICGIAEERARVYSSICEHLYTEHTSISLLSKLEGTGVGV